MILRSLAHLLAFWPPAEVTRFLLDIRRIVTSGVLLATVHADCVDEWVLRQLHQLPTTLVVVEREAKKKTTTTTYPKICTVTHRRGFLLLLLLSIII